MAPRNSTDDPSGDVQEKSRHKVVEPPMYQVILHNDDYTTMEFVVEVLKIVFHKNPAEASAIMLAVHKKGRGIVGAYTHDIAATRIEQTRHLAKENGFPLKCTMEPVPR